MAEIARHTIGFANRDPASAARHAEGYGYLVLGSEPENLQGVKPIDMAELDGGVAPYLGRDGPHWIPQFLEVGGSTVLVVTVPPPAQGNPIYCLQKEFSESTGPERINYRNGEIFVRRHGRTERANAADMRMLQRRLGAVRPRLDVDLTWWEQESRVTPLDLSDQAVGAWIDGQRRSLARPIPPPPKRETAASMAGLDIGNALRGLGHLGVQPENRTPEEYDKQVEDYLEEARPALLSLLRMQAVRVGIGRLHLAVLNLGDDNFENVVTELFLPGAVAAFFDVRETEDQLDFPARPRKWGPRTFDYRIAAPFMPHNLGIERLSPGKISNSGSSTVRFAPVHVRPQHKHSLHDIHVVAIAGEASLLDGTWTATATNVSGTAKGEFTIPLKDPITPVELMRQEPQEDELD